MIPCTLLREYHKCCLGCALLTVLSRGSDGRPSFASLVANVDSEGAKYIATSSVQEGRVEMVEDLKSMTEVGNSRVFVIVVFC